MLHGSSQKGGCFALCISFLSIVMHLVYCDIGFCNMSRRRLDLNSTISIHYPAAAAALSRMHAEAADRDTYFTAKGKRRRRKRRRRRKGGGRTEQRREKVEEGKVNRCCQSRCILLHSFPYFKILFLSMPAAILQFDFLCAIEFSC
jgi:hypothetical protein